ncbi:hypothetical protein ACPPVO_37115 [Dactylosporangium sp. McL0621]|uniref:hypothetical protein n=1 Tax=Dactylosporangium sp. McL0621 TaxID=3415678 RepID=UPI003CF5D578
MSLFRSKTLWITVGAVVVANVVVFALAGPAGTAGAAKMAASADANLAVVALLIGVIWWLTRKRAAVDLTARAPGRRRAGREVAGVLACRWRSGCTSSAPCCPRWCWCTRSCCPGTAR